MFVLGFLVGSVATLAFGIFFGDHIARYIYDITWEQYDRVHLEEKHGERQSHQWTETTGDGGSIYDDPTTETTTNHRDENLIPFVTFDR